MTPKTYTRIILVILITLLFLQYKMTYEFSDIFTLLYIMVVVPGLVFSFKYFPKDKKQFHKKVFIYLAFCVVLGVILALLV